VFLANYRMVVNYITNQLSVGHLSVAECIVAKKYFIQKTV